MTETLKTKNVFLTGGAQGLGKSYLDGLLAKGARVRCELKTLITKFATCVVAAVATAPV